MTATVLKLTGSPPPDEATILSAGDVHLDVARYQAIVGGKPVALTYQEFDLLRLLLSKPDRILPYDELVQGLWHGSTAGTRRRLGVVVCRLRAKLRGSGPYRIQTVRGRGYGLTTTMKETSNATDMN